jgi:hypothetical protein
LQCRSEHPWIFNSIKLHLLCEIIHAASLYGYSNLSFPVQYRPSLADIQTVNWYDNYGFKQLSTIGSNYDFPPIPPGGSTSNSFVSNVKGMITGSLERVEGMPGLDLVTVNYYDNRLRLICSVIDNHCGRSNDFFSFSHLPRLISYCSRLPTR